MVISATDDGIVYELVVRFGTERAIVTIRCAPDGTAALSTQPGEPSP
jgi:hypothetical protein